MTTYTELMTQAQALIDQADQIRKQERSGVIASIMSQLREHGLSVDDLSAAACKPKPSRGKLPAKYRGPNGELWSGGPGRRPEWVKAVLEAGGRLNDYLLPDGLISAAG